MKLNKQKRNSMAQTVVVELAEYISPTKHFGNCFSLFNQHSLFNLILFCQQEIGIACGSKQASLLPLLLSEKKNGNITGVEGGKEASWL